MILIEKRTCRWKHWRSCTPETQGKLLTSFGHKHTGKPHTPQSSSANARAVCQAAASAHALMAAAQETTLAIHLPESHPQIMVMWSLQRKWIWINKKKDTNMQNPSKYTATLFLNTSSTLPQHFLHVFIQYAQQLCSLYLVNSIPPRRWIARSHSEAAMLALKLMLSGSCQRQQIAKTHRILQDTIGVNGRVECFGAKNWGNFFVWSHGIELRNQATHSYNYAPLLVAAAARKSSIADLFPETQRSSKRAGLGEKSVGLFRRH